MEDSRLSVLPAWNVSLGDVPVTLAWIPASDTSKTAYVYAVADEAFVITCANGKNSFIAISHTLAKSVETECTSRVPLFSHFWDMVLLPRSIALNVSDKSDVSNVAHIFPPLTGYKAACSTPFSFHQL